MSGHIIITGATIAIIMVYITLLIPHTDAAAAACPPNFTFLEENEMCFRVFDRLRNTSDEAKTVCKESSFWQPPPQLAVVPTISAARFIQGMLTAGKQYWIGARKDSENNVSYLNGTRLPFEAPWTGGEPNNHRGHEECVEMIANRRETWNDKRCSKKRPFVCSWGR